MRVRVRIGDRVSSLLVTINPLHCHAELGPSLFGLSHHGAPGRHAGVRPPVAEPLECPVHGHALANRRVGKLCPLVKADAEHPVPHLCRRSAQETTLPSPLLHLCFPGRHCRAQHEVTHTLDDPCLQKVGTSVPGVLLFLCSDHFVDSRFPRAHAASDELVDGERGGRGGEGEEKRELRMRRQISLAPKPLNHPELTKRPTTLSSRASTFRMR